MDSSDPCCPPEDEFDDIYTDSPPSQNRTAAQQTTIAPAKPAATETDEFDDIYSEAQPQETAGCKSGCCGKNTAASAQSPPPAASNIVLDDGFPEDEFDDIYSDHAPNDEVDDCCSSGNCCDTEVKAELCINSEPASADACCASKQTASCCSSPDPSQVIISGVKRDQKASSCCKDPSSDSCCSAPSKPDGRQSQLDTDEKVDRCCSSARTETKPSSSCCSKPIQSPIVASSCCKPTSGPSSCAQSSCAKPGATGPSCGSNAAAKSCCAAKPSTQSACCNKEPSPPSSCCDKTSSSKSSCGKLSPDDSSCCSTKAADVPPRSCAKPCCKPSAPSCAKSCCPPQPPAACSKQCCEQPQSLAAAARSTPPTSLCAKECCQKAEASYEATVTVVCAKSCCAKEEKQPLMTPTVSIKVIDIDSSETDVMVAQLSINGMTCADCSALAESKIGELPGVSRVQVSPLTAIGSVTFSAKLMPNPEIMCDILKSIGFATTILSCLTAAEAAQSRPLATLSLLTSSIKSKKEGEAVCKALSSQFKENASLEVSFSTSSKAPSTIVLSYDPQLVQVRECLQFLEEQQGIEFTFPPTRSALSESNHATEYSYRIRLIFSIIFCIPVLLIAFIFPTAGGDAHDQLEEELMADFPVSALINWILCTPIQFGVGWPLYVSAYKALRFGGTANIDCLVMLSTTTAYVYSVICAFAAFSRSEFNNEYFFETCAILLTLIMLGRYLEVLSKQRTADVLHTLHNLQSFTAIICTPKPSESKGDCCSSGACEEAPSMADLATTGVDEEIDARLLQHGDIMRILPGASIPTDGVVVWGNSSVDESMVTGESTPVPKQPMPSIQAQTTSDKSMTIVYGGTINQHGTLLVRVTHTLGENTLSAISKRVLQAQMSKPDIQRIADKISSYFVPTIIVLSISVFIIWIAIAASGSVSTTLPPVTFALRFAIAVLVVSCPCAIGLAVPTAIMVATGVAAKHGVLFADSTVLEHAHTVDTVVFDKTGTLTEGKPKVCDHQLMDQTKSPSRIWFLIGSAEKASEHPIARAVGEFAISELTALKSASVELVSPSEFQATPGKGINCLVDGQRVIIGSIPFVQEYSDQTQQNQADFSQAAAICDTWQSEGCTTICCSIDGTLTAIVALKDSLRPESHAAVSALESKGLQVWLLSGDSVATTQRVAAQLGLDGSRVFGGVLPHQKAERVAALQKANRRVCMVGDGVNDAVALAQADVGVAVSSGSEVSMAASSIVLLKNNLFDVLFALDLSRHTFRRININFLWAFLYNLTAIPLAVGLFYPLGDVYIPPALAGLSELLSSLPVVLFSLHLQRYRFQNPT